MCPGHLVGSLSSLSVRVGVKDLEMYRLSWRLSDAVTVMVEAAGVRVVQPPDTAPRIKSVSPRRG